MPDRPLFLLSPYRPPTSYPITLSAGEAASWLNAYAAMWHPTVLKYATKPVELASSYDHDDPTPNAIYVVPGGPTLYQPGDWAERLKNAGAASFTSTPDRAETIANLHAAINEPVVTQDCHRLFSAIGFAYLTIETWFDAAQHDHLLDAEGFWNDIKTALNHLEDIHEVRKHLKLAGEKLQVAREVLHSGSIRLLDIVAIDLEKRMGGWPESLANGLPLTVVASAHNLARLKADEPERFAELMAKCPPGLPASVEFAVGSHVERDDVILPIESQLWNLQKGKSETIAITGQETTTFGRTKATSHLQLPSWLSHLNFRHALATPISGDGGTTTKSPCLQWPGPDGKTIEAFSKDYLPASDAQTFFNLAYYLHQASGQEATPALGLLHRNESTAESYRDLIAFADLSTALGEWQSVGQYLTEVGTGDYCGVAGPDDFSIDTLDERVSKRDLSKSVSAFAKSLRLRRRIDAAFGLAALQRTLSPATPEEVCDLESLTREETQFENQNPDGSFDSSSFELIETRIAQRLADRIQLRSEPNRPGYLLLNPCNFTRRVALELPPFANPIAIADPIKAAQFDSDRTRLVVEVPSLGFAWIPRSGPRVAPAKPKLVMASETTVRNEFFEAEFDPASGGIRAFRDLKFRSNRMGVVPVFNPGCKSRCTGIKIVHSGAALGEIVSTGELISETDEPLASFSLSARAWLGRPVLELSCTWQLTHQPNGFPWHAYFGLRFGVRDDRIATYRGINGNSYPANTARIVSPDFFEFRFGKERSFLFPGGVPFLNKVSPRTYDWIHIPQGETQTKFECLLSLDRDNPMQTAAGWVAPTAVVPTDRGPPLAGSSSWLAHLDMPSVIVTDFRPTTPTGDGSTRAIAMRFIESTGYAGMTELRFARDPARAFHIDGLDQTNHEISLKDGAAPIDYSAGELVRIRAEWL